MKGGGKLFSWLDDVSDKEKVVQIETDKIDPNPYQPRRDFDAEKIKELAQSIKVYGLLQPIIVRQVEKDTDRYQLIAGERRLKACQELGRQSIGAVMRELPDNAVATIALIENLQRENLNFLEEAEGYVRLMEEFNLTQEVLAQRLGKSQSTIANKIRLLKLPESVKNQMLSGAITERHARALLKLDSPQKQTELVEEVKRKGLNVKETEKRIEDKMSATEPSSQKGQKKTTTGKVVVRDMRIFLNTIRHAVDAIERAGLTPEVKEKESDDYFEITVRLPKKKAKSGSRKFIK